MKLMGEVLAAALSQRDGLTAAYLPPSVDVEMGEAVVKAANARRQESPSYAILVTSRDDLSESNCPRLTPQSAIQYRKDNRLAIVSGRHPDLASFVQAFSCGMDEGFPLSASGSVTIANLSKIAIDLLVREVGGSEAHIAAQAAGAERLTAVLELLADSYQALGQGTKTWNAFWFTHASAGLESLAQILRELPTTNPEMSLDDALDEFTYASFALPKPSNGQALLKGSAQAGRRLVDALNSYWSDQSSVAATCQQLRYHPDTRPAGAEHALESLDWSGFGRHLAGEGNLLRAWYLSGRNAEPTAGPRAFARLTEAQFLNPYQSLDQQQLELFTAGDVPLKLGPEPKQPSLLACRLDEATSRYVTDEVHVRIPTLSPPDPLDVANSALTISGSPASANWSGNLEIRTDGSLWAIGQMSYAAGKPPHKLPGRPVTFSAAAPAEDPLLPLVPAASSSSIYLIVDGSAGALAFPRASKGILGRASHVGPELLEAPADTPYTLEVEAPQLEIVVWSSDSGAQPTMGNATFQQAIPGASVWVGSLLPTGIDVLELGDLQIEFSKPDDSTEYQSPLIAALQGGAVTAKDPLPLTVSSVRGQYELKAAQAIAQPEFLQALGHVAALSNQSHSLVDAALTPDMAILAPREHALDGRPRPTSTYQRRWWGLPRHKNFVQP